MTVTRVTWPVDVCMLSFLGSRNPIWRLFYLLPSLLYYLMFASINLLKGGGESRIIYTLDPGAEIVSIWQKDIFLCTPLLGISQWVSWQFAPEIVQRFNNLCTVLWMMLHFYYSWVFWVLHKRQRNLLHLLLVKVYIKLQNNNLRRGYYRQNSNVFRLSPTTVIVHKRKKYKASYIFTMRLYCLYLRAWNPAQGAINLKI